MAVKGCSQCHQALSITTIASEAFCMLLCAGTTVKRTVGSASDALGQLDAEVLCIQCSLVLTVTASSSNCTTQRQKPNTDWQYQSPQAASTFY